MATKKAVKSADKESAPAQAASAKKEGPLEVVVFALGNELFAIDLFDVREVVEYTAITKLPNVPPEIRGIMDLRGEITTIVDLRRRLNLPETARENLETARIVVLDNNVTRSKTGILVDDVTSVSTFGQAQVDYTSSYLSQEDTAIIGIIKKKVKIQDTESSELIIWIDVRKLLADVDSA